MEDNIKSRGSRLAGIFFFSLFNGKLKLLCLRTVTFFPLADWGISPVVVLEEVAENTGLHLCPDMYLSLCSIRKLHGIKRRRKNKVSSLHESMVTGYS